MKLKITLISVLLTGTLLVSAYCKPKIRADIPVEDLVGLVGASGSVPSLPTTTGSTGCNPVAGTGNIDITVTSTAANPAIVIFGPTGFYTTVAGTAGASPVTHSLTGVPSGEYIIIPKPIRGTAGALVDSFYTATLTGGTLCLNNGETLTSTVAYSATQSTGRLWSAKRSGGKFHGYAASLLAASATIDPATHDIVTNADSRGMAFDNYGRIWINNIYNSKIYAYRVVDIMSSNTPSPVAVINSSAIDGPREMAFDSMGNLYLASIYNNRVLRFNKNELYGFRTIAPSFQITGLTGPDAIAFDPGGNLWVGNAGYYGTTDGALLQFKSAALSASGGTLTPDVTIRACANSTTLCGGYIYRFPKAIAFDSNISTANMIVYYGDDGRLIKLSSAKYNAGGDIDVSTATANIGLSTFAVVTHMAFDNGGNLWIAYGKDVITTQSIIKINSGNLTGTTLTIGVDLNIPTNLDPWSTSFFPSITSRSVLNTD